MTALAIALAAGSLGTLVGVFIGYRFGYSDGRAVLFMDELHKAVKSIDPDLVLHPDTCRKGASA